MLKNKYHANVRMAAVLITLSSAVNDRYWSCFFGCVSVFSSLFINTQDSFIKRTLSVDLGTVNEKQAVKHSPT